MAIKPEKREHKDGTTSWHCLVELGRDPLTRRRRQKRVTGRTAKECREKAAAEIAAAGRGERTEQARQPFGEFVAAWVRAAADRVRPSTALAYRRIMDDHILPALGPVPIKDVSPAMLRTFEQDLRTKLAPGTVRNIRMVVRAVLRQAVADRVLIWNPAPAAPHRSETQAEPLRVWTLEQAQAFLAGDMDDRERALWRIMLLTGMRVGEVIALQWGDINLAAGTITVRRTATRGPDGKLTVGPTKTGRERIVAVTPAVTAALATYRAGRAAVGAALVFPSSKGTLWHGQVINALLKRRCRQLGVPVLRVHDLRHTAATLMLALGTPPHVVQQRLGHASIQMTLNRYSHVLPGQDGAAAATLATALLTATCDTLVTLATDEPGLPHGEAVDSG